MDNFEGQERYEKSGQGLRLAALLSVPVGILVWIVLGAQASSLTEKARLSTIGTQSRGIYTSATADSLNVQADMYNTMGLLAFLVSIGLCVLCVRLANKVTAGG